MAEDLPYQQAAQVRQLLAERENAEAYGQTERLAAVDKQLKGLGYKRPAQAEKATEAAEERAAAAAAEEEDEAKTAAPKGRSVSSPRKTTAEGK